MYHRIGIGSNYPGLKSDLHISKVNTYNYFFSEKKKNVTYFFLYTVERSYYSSPKRIADWQLGARRLAMDRKNRTLPENSMNLS